MKRPVVTTADRQPAVGHIVRDHWDGYVLTRSWLLPVSEIQRNAVPVDAGLRLVERPDGTITAALVIVEAR